MVRRQVRLIGLLLLGSILAAAIGSMLWFGPDAPFHVAPDGRIETTGQMAIRSCAIAGFYTLVADRLSRQRRWRRNIVRAGGTFAISWIGILVLVLSRQVIDLFGALGHPVDHAGYAVAVALLLLVKANLLPKSRPAWFNGVTLPVVAGDLGVWRRVHRWSAGRLVAIGLGTLALLAIGRDGAQVLPLLMKVLIAEFCLTTLHAVWLRPTAGASAS